jgi:electron transport complex protein RnfD
VRFATSSAPHTIAGYTVPRVMVQVLAGLVPVAIAHVVVFGPGLLLQLAVACPTALLCEAAALRLRGRAAGPCVRDGSVMVTAVLLSMCLTPLLPWWLTAAGTATAVLIGKHAFGGLGQNPFNPAMVGYAALLVSCPAEMTRWPLPLGAGTHEWGDLATLTIQSFYAGPSAIVLPWDAYTGATALDALRTGLGQRYTMQEVMTQPAFGAIGGAGFQWINLAALAGGMLLLARRVIRWQIPVAFLMGLLAPAFVAHAIDPGANAGPLFHALSGATMLGAFFIATDPVSAATSDRGRLVYGFGIGLLVWIIRRWGVYPDGVAFAVLLMNLAVPFIDLYTVPRIHGQPKR